MHHVCDILFNPHEPIITKLVSCVASRQSSLIKSFMCCLQPVQTLDEAVEQAVALRVESERKKLAAEYQQREASLLSRISQLETSLAAPTPKKK